MCHLEKEPRLGDNTGDDAETKKKLDEQEAQIATLQASVQQLYATLQDHANKYSVLYEENKTLKEREDQIAAQQSSTEVPESVVQVAEAVALSSQQQQQQQEAVASTSPNDRTTEVSATPVSQEQTAVPGGTLEKY